MTILGNGLPFFGSFFTSHSAKPDRFRKSISPISHVLKRQQPFSASSHKALPKSTTTSHHTYTKQDTYTGASTGTGGAAGSTAGPEVVTENSILSNFPRPNLMPTLHFSLFGYQSSPSNGQENRKTSGGTSLCINCFGPHSTDFCPC